MLHKWTVLGLFFVCACLATFGGCSCSETGSDVAEATEELGEGASQLADEVTGVRAYEQGKEIKKQIGDIKEAQKKKLEEVAP